MLVHSITVVLNAFKHRKDIGLKVNKFMRFKNRNEYLGILKQFKIDRCHDRYFHPMLRNSGPIAQVVERPLRER